MFWDNFYNACISRGIKPNPLAKELNIASGSMTSWKNGKIPNGETLLKISEYLGVSVDYLLGRVDEPTATIKTVQGYAPPKILEEQNNLDELSKELLKTFKKLSFRDKISVLNYALNIESPPQIVQNRKSAEEPKRERVPYVARDLSGKNTKGFIDISDEDLAKAEVEDYSKYD